MRLRPIALVACIAVAAIACGIDAIGTQPLEALPDGSSSSGASSSASSSSSGGTQTDAGVEPTDAASETDAVSDAPSDVLVDSALVPPYLVLTHSAAGAAPINLTTEGTTDWAYWGANGVVSSTRKAVSTGISALYHPMVSLTASTGFGATFTWSDGDVGSTTGSGDWFVWYPSITADYFLVRAPAGPVKQTLVVGVGGNNIRGRMIASFTDGSTPAKVDSTYSNLAGTIAVKYVVEYASVAPTQVELRWEADVVAASGAQIRFTAAALR